MSTASSVGVISEGKYISSYCHSDGYPGGVGVDVVTVIKMINEKNGWERLKSNIKKVVKVSIEKTPTEKQQKRYNNLGYSNINVGTQTLKDWYCLLREVQGGKMFYEIYKGRLKHIILANDFIKDSLFCEYAYVINLDTMKFEIYFGFQKNSQIGNKFGELPDKHGYYPCKMIVEFSLKSIPKNWLNKVQKIEEK